MTAQAILCIFVCSSDGGLFSAEVNNCVDNGDNGHDRTRGDDYCSDGRTGDGGHLSPGDSGDYRGDDCGGSTDNGEDTGELA